jgi:hypothetical protein
MACALSKAVRKQQEQKKKDLKMARALEEYQHNVLKEKSLHESLQTIAD